LKRLPPLTARCPSMGERARVRGQFQIFEL